MAMEGVALAVEIMKGCLKVARDIKGVVEGATFMNDRCQDLVDHVETVVHPLEQLDEREKDPGTSKSVRSFLLKLRETLNDCNSLIDKCSSMGKVAAGIASITKKASYNEKFNRLEKRLDRLTLPASLANMENLEEVKQLAKEIKEQVSVDEPDDSSEDTGIICDVCDGPIKYGQKLYHCTFCADYDICASCFSPYTHDEHKQHIVSGICPEFHPYDIDYDDDDDDDSNVVDIICDICQQKVKNGAVFYHCQACIPPEEFDACDNCYNPHIHSKHQADIESGIFPDFAPYELHHSAFKFFDQDKDGKITLEDLLSGAAQLEENLDEERAHAMIEQFDDDGNGRIEFDEFVKLFKAMMAEETLDDGEEDY